MKEALKEAYKAYMKRNTNGAIIVKDNQIIARAHNSTETLKPQYRNFSDKTSIRK